MNKDTNSYIFLTKNSYNHAFSNNGELQINASEHLPEFVENAVLTYIEGRTHGNTFASKVFTLFAAADSGKGIVPVKLTVKEIAINGQDIPKNISEYFKEHGMQNEYNEMYDAVVLELLDIEEDPSGSDASSQNTDTRRIPSGSPVVRITDLLDTVKGDAKKYIPSNENVSEQASTAIDDSSYISLAEKYRDGTATEEETEQLRKMVDEAARKAMPNTKILDEDGNLLTVYHGTSERFTEFDMSKGRTKCRICGYVCTRTSKSNGKRKCFFRGNQAADGMV